MPPSAEPAAAPPRRSGAWMPRERWDALVRGDGCPLCRDLASGTEPNDHRHVVADLSVAQLWLPANQSIPGYCVLVHRRHVREPYELPPDERAAFFEDMMRVGAALERAFGAVKMNFELQGNSVPHLHCHVKPRTYGDPGPGRPLQPSERMVRLTAPEYAERAAIIRAALAHDVSPSHVSH